MQARRKLIINTFVSTRLFVTPWECHPLQDCKDRRGLEWSKNFKKLEELVHFLHDFTRACILFEFANDPANHTAKAQKSTGSTASFEIHGKYNTNLIDFIDNGAPFDTSGAYIPSVFYLLASQWQWHFRSSCRSCCRCVFAITFYFEISNPIYRQWRPFLIDPGACNTHPLPNVSLIDGNGIVFGVAGSLAIHLWP
jgi:hypothetical protein